MIVATVGQGFVHGQETGRADLAMGGRRLLKALWESWENERVREVCEARQREDAAGCIRPVLTF